MMDVLLQLLQNPATYIIMLVQFLLGFFLGYLSIKALKYILALVAILAFGLFLNVWSLGLSLETLVGRFGEYAIKAKDLLMGLAGTLGLLTIGPVMIGFVVGIVVAAIKGK